MTQNQIVGAIKIKDGLFIGDEFASQDREFIVTNKVTHIINCSGAEVQNKWGMMGVKYLTFNWLEQDNEVLFDEKNENVNKIFAFIEECFSLGESSLVHSVRGQSRACSVLAAYFMKKYSWTLYKTLEYLNSRRPDLEIRASFFYQLNSLESRLNKIGPKRTASWNELTQDEGNPNQVHEELIIRNTFLNSQNGPVDDIYTNLQTKIQMLGKIQVTKLKWKDLSNKENNQLATLVYTGSPDFLPSTEIQIKQNSDKAPILKGAQNSRENSVNKQIQMNLPKSSIQPSSCQQNKQTSKSQIADSQEQVQQTSLVSPNTNASFQNLLQNFTGKSKTQHQEKNPNQQQLTNNVQNAKAQQLKQGNPQLVNQPSGIRSTSLQQNDEKKSQLEIGNNRPSSVKQKDNPSSILTNFQEFKNQVQQSLNYFNKQSEAIFNFDKQMENIFPQPQQQQQQQPQTQFIKQENQQLSAQNNYQPQIQNPSQIQLQKSKLDQLISPTFISTMSSAKHQELQKTLTQSISQLQSSYQKFQQLQQKNQLKQSQSQVQIQQQKNLNQTEITSTTTANLSKAQERSSSLNRKPEDLDSKNRPNSADIKDQQLMSNKKKKESLSPFQKDPIKKLHQHAPPLPQSNSQIYLRNVQCRRQAASTLRNQQKPITNNSFQDKYLNQSANQVQNNSFINNSNSGIEQQQDAKVQPQQKQSSPGLIADLNQFKKLISPQSLTKSQASFTKNQPIKVLQELTDKTQSIKSMKPQDNQITSFIYVQKPATTNARTFSPAIKNDSKSKSNLSTNMQSLRQQVRNQSPGIQKEQETSNSFIHPLQKNNWKML